MSADRAEKGWPRPDAGARLLRAGVWPPLAFAAAAVALWQLLSSFGGFETFILPAPADVASTFWRERDLLWRNGVVTAEEALLAFALGIAIGVPTGVLSVKSRLFSFLVYPFVVGSQAVPKLALTPIFAVWLGFGMASKVVVGFLIAFFPIAINTAVGLASVDADAQLLGRSIGLGQLRTLTKIEFPAALPSIFGGLKIGIAFAVIGAVVGELIGADTGLGKVTLTASTTLDTPLLLAALVALGILGVVAYGGVSAVERAAVPREERQEWLGTQSV